MIIANSAVFSAVYLAYAYLSSMLLGQILHGIDIHFLRALLLVILAARLRGAGGPTTMGFISGILLASAPFSSPDKPVIPFDHSCWGDI